MLPVLSFLSVTMPWMPHRLRTGPPERAAFCAFRGTTSAFLLLRSPQTSEAPTFL